MRKKASPATQLITIAADGDPYHLRDTDLRLCISNEWYRCVQLTRNVQCGEHAEVLGRGSWRAGFGANGYSDVRVDQILDARFERIDARGHLAHYQTNSGELRAA